MSKREAKRDPVLGEVLVQYWASGPEVIRYERNDDVFFGCECWVLKGKFQTAEEADAFAFALRKVSLRDSLLQRLATQGDHNAKVLLALARKDPTTLKAHADAIAKMNEVK